MAEIPRYGYSPGNRPERKCFVHTDCEELRDRYGERVRPICNCEGHQTWLAKVWHFALPPAPKLESPVAQRAWRILTVAEKLAGMELDEATVHLWANVPGLLDSYMEPIWDDMKALPIALKAKGCAEESRQCEEVFARLTNAVDAYGRDSASRSREDAYLMPPEELLRSQGTGLPEHARKSLQFGFFENWRKEESQERKMMGLDYEAERIHRMSNTVPVHVGAAASKVVQVLKPILDAFMEAEKQDAVNAQPVQTNPAYSNLRRHRRKKRGQPTISTFTPWVNAPRRTCFVLDDNRFMFWHNGAQKDLRLGGKGRCHKLLILFSAGDMLAESSVKSAICTTDVKPIHAVRDVNRELNRKIGSLGFTDVPTNVAFVYHDGGTHAYCIRPRVLSREGADDLWGSDS
jgi:hypothetical protein